MANDYFFTFKIIKSISFCHWTVPNKYAFFTFIIKFSSFFLEVYENNKYFQKLWNALQVAWFHSMFQSEFCSSRPLLNIYWECTRLSEKFFGNTFSLRISVAISTVVLFFRSATSFYCGLYPAVSWFQIPSSLQNSSNCSECACLSLWIILILLPLCSSTNALNLLNTRKVSDFFFRKCTQVILE